MPSCAIHFAFAANGEEGDVKWGRGKKEPGADRYGPKHAQVLGFLLRWGSEHVFALRKEA